MTGKNILQRLLAQITSGRWIVTVVAAACLIMLTHTLCSLMIAGKIVLEAATYVAIIMAVLNTVQMVVTFYFQKNRPDDNGYDNSDTTTTTTTTIPIK